MPALLEADATLATPRDIVTPMSLQAVSSDREAQRAWAARPIAQRLQILRSARHRIAATVDQFCAAIPEELARNPADTQVAEILPLLSAIKFLEHEAAQILAPRRLSWRRRPAWLAGVWSEVHRVPMGQVLVIAPSNYPLFLPGGQVVQALAAGNAVLWKPGTGGQAVAELFASTMQAAGLPRDLLTVTAESIEAAQAAISAGVDKVFFTGSATSGKALLKQLADTLTPCVAELSGCDAVFVLPSADISRVIKALAFGMRLNGSATCMAPRRIILIGADVERRKLFITSLLTALDWVKGIRLPQKIQSELNLLFEDAITFGAEVHGHANDSLQPILVTGVTPSMRIAQADIFAPVLSLLVARDITEAIAFNEACPYALTAAIFGDEPEARTLAAAVTAGTVIINDLMVPAADPRTPFGGRRSSGFGTTQGAEGLLEMTAAKTIAVRRGSSTRHFDATTVAHESLFSGIIRASHSATVSQRFAGLKQLVRAAIDMNGKQ